MPSDKSHHEGPAEGGREAEGPGVEASGGLVARVVVGVPRRLLAWVKAHWLKAGLLAVVVTLSVVGGGIMTVMLATRHDPNAEVTLEMALDAVEHGNLADARTWAKALAARGRSLPTEEAGGPAYVFGVAAYDDAQESWSKDKRPAFLVAARFLEEARDRGFPADRRARGLLLLGKALFFSDQFAASRPILREALRANPEERARSEIHYLLAEANLRDTVPKLDDALADNAEYLKSRSLSSGERDKGLLQQAQILFRMNEVSRCGALLDRIPADSPAHAQVVVVRGRLLLREALALKGKPEATAEDRAKTTALLEAAIKTLRTAQGADTLANEATRWSTYLIGVCFLELGDTRAAADQFNRTRMLFPDSPEALASDLQEAELNRRSGRNEAAMACYRRMLAAVADPDGFSNPYFTIAEVRQRVLTAYDDYQRTHNFPSALELAGAMHPLFPRTRSMELVAQTYRQWGESLLEQAAHLPASKATPLEREGRGRLREAGQAYARLAKARIATAEYPDDLWNSAGSLLAGHAYRDAVRAFRTYLRNESRRRSPRALVGMGEALLALDDLDGALEAFDQCIELHPNDAVTFRARLLASRAYREKQKYDDAEKLLKDNLGGDAITPRSEIWMDSLFDLGELLHDTGRLEEATERLEEAVQRLPDSPRAVTARYLIADGYRRRAQAARAELRKEVVENARLAQTKEIEQLLKAARERFDDLKQRLLDRRDKTELTEQERRILRNCFFSIGDVLFELGEYPEAVKAYSIITNRYQSRPEVLQAYLQIVRAYQRLGDAPQARRTLQHAKVVLRQMPKDADFREGTNHDRQEWEQLFDSLAVR